MSKRLQVVLDETDLQGYERAAREAGVSLSEWVRGTLRAAEREVAMGDVDAKLSAVRDALRHDFPAPDVDIMLEEIEQGYRGTVDA
jgi:hypothetical protein